MLYGYSCSCPSTGGVREAGGHVLITPTVYAHAGFQSRLEFGEGWCRSLELSPAFPPTSRAPHTTTWLWEIPHDWVHLVLLSICLLVAVAFFTLGERKLMAAVQRRKGPDVVGFWGLLQPLADGFKLVLKELIFPHRTPVLSSIVGPLLIFALSLLGWIAIPHTQADLYANLSLAVLFSFVVGGLGVYGLIISGWSSNSRYAFLGSVRATAQMISYELTLGTVNLIVALFAGSYSYVEIVLAQRTVWFVAPLLPAFLIFLVVMLAETNRTPFDLAEAEAELVAGYNVEYSSMMFALFFLAEYANMVLLSVICTLYFLGGWLPFVPLAGDGGPFWLFSKAILFCILFVWVRATLPRYRYDQLMGYGWKVLLPLSFSLFIFYAGLTAASAVISAPSGLWLDIVHGVA